MLHSIFMLARSDFTGASSGFDVARYLEEATARQHMILDAIKDYEKTLKALGIGSRLQEGASPEISRDPTCT